MAEGGRGSFSPLWRRPSPQNGSLILPSTYAGISSPPRSSDETPASPALLSDAKFRQNLHEMRSSEEMCDVQILVENACFSTHKLVLAACSPYFRAMFRANNFDESTSKEIRIDPKVVPKKNKNKNKNKKHTHTHTMTYTFL